MKNNNFTILIFAITFSLIGGAFGAMFAKSYIVDSIYYQMPWTGEINPALKNRNIFPGENKKVVVEQSDQIFATISESRKSLVGFFPKVSDLEEDHFYNLQENIAQGLIVTGDGWVVLGDFSGELEKKEDLEKYLAIDRERKIYELSDMARDDATGLIFVRLENAVNLPVRSFAGFADMKEGKTILLGDWRDRYYPSLIVAKVDKNNSLLHFSDELNHRYEITKEEKQNFFGAFVFDLGGQVMGAIDKDQKILPAYYLDSALKLLLANNKIERIKLGLYYQNTKNLVKNDGEILPSGALIREADSKIKIETNVRFPEKLQEKDIIVALNGNKIRDDQDFSALVQEIVSGRRLELEYIRDKESKKMEISLIDLFK